MGKSVIKASEPAAALAVPQTGGLAMSGMEQVAGGDGVMLGRLAMYNGTATEEKKYAGCDFRRGNWFDVMEKRLVHASAVQIVPVAVFPSWVRFRQDGALEYSTRNIKHVPPTDLVWPEKGTKNADGKYGPLAAEVWNFVVLVKGEPWPYLLRLKRTGIDAAKQIVALEYRYATNGTGHRLYELGSQDAQNGAKQDYKKVTSRLVSTCPEDMQAMLAVVKSQIANVIATAQQKADDDDAGGDAHGDDSNLPV